MHKGLCLYTIDRYTGHMGLPEQTAEHLEGPPLHQTWYCSTCARACTSITFYTHHCLSQSLTSTEDSHCPERCCLWCCRSERNRMEAHVSWLWREYTQAVVIDTKVRAGGPVSGGASTVASANAAPVWKRGAESSVCPCWERAVKSLQSVELDGPAQLSGSGSMQSGGLNSSTPGNQPHTRSATFFWIPHPVATEQRGDRWPRSKGSRAPF